MTDLSHLRVNYDNAPLTIEALPSNPVLLFQQWYDPIQALPDSNAMTLATTNTNGQPNARMVLLKHYSEDGFVFFSNYDSQKGKELEANPFACLVFWWQPINRQVRIQGTVRKLSQKASDDYFATRPKPSNFSACISQQSQVIISRKKLEQGVNLLDQQHPQADPIPRPQHWGGYIVAPICIEFWQGMRNRLHDRFLYKKTDQKNWTIQRLAP